MCTGVSSSLTNEERAVFAIPRVFNFLMRKSTLLRILYWKERKVCVLSDFSSMLEIRIEYISLENNLSAN